MRVDQVRKKMKMLFTAEQIKQRVQQLGQQISQDYGSQEVHLISLLRGSFVFTSDLIRNIQSDLIVDFLQLSSYGSSQVREKTVTALNTVEDLGIDLKGKHVLVVDDILDSGHTMQKMLQNLGQHQPKSLEGCVLLDKPSRREVKVDMKYIGFEIENLFIVGYGLDYNQKSRQLPYIGYMP